MMAGHNYWVEDFLPEPAITTHIRGIRPGTPRLIVFIDPPNDPGLLARRSYSVLTYEEAKRLTRALQEFLIRKEIASASTKSHRV